MDCTFKQLLNAWTLAIVCLLPINAAHAVAYTFPGNAVAPLTLAIGDSLAVNSGTFQTTNNISFTVDFSAGGVTGPIDIASGATLGYAGTSPLGKAINATANGALNTTITNNGTVSSGTGVFSIYVTNSTANTGTLIINNNSAIVGSVFTNNLNSVTLNLDGNASIAGGVNMSGGTTRVINVGQTTACNFTATGTYDGMTLIRVFNGSTFTQNDSFTEITVLTIDAGGTYNVNATLGGASPDGALNNNGTLNIAANINKTGFFVTGVGSNTIVSQTVNVATSSYDNDGTHTAQIFDLNNIGYMTLTSATATPVNFSTFTLDYTGGYLTTGTYTLFTTAAGIDTAPTTINTPDDTLFLNFSQPVATTNNITVDIQRTPFSSFAANGYTENIGIALEAMGNNDPTSDMLSLLNGVEGCTTANCVQSSLQQLGPLVTAPLYAYTIETVTLRTAELRLAALKTDHYMAGEISDYDQFIMGSLLRENYIWIRPYGAYANQEQKNDILGYYATTGGIAVGFDRNLDARYNLGLAFAYSSSNVRDKVNTNSTTAVKSYQGMLYGTYNFTSSRYLDWIASVTGNQYTGSRYMQINSFIATASSKYSSQLFTFKGIMGTNFAAFDFLQVTPEASLMYTFAKQYTYQETNAGAANLIVNRPDSNTVQLGIGGKLSIPLAAMPSVVVPEIHAMYLYNVVNGKQNSVFNFVDGPTQVISQFSPSRSALRYGAALTVAVFDSLQVKLAIDAETQDRYSSYWVYLNLKYLL